MGPSSACPVSVGEVGKADVRTSQWLGAANPPDVDIEDSVARFLPFIYPFQRQLLRAQCETPNRIWPVGWSSDAWIRLKLADLLRCVAQYFSGNCPWPMLAATPSQDATVTVHCKAEDYVKIIMKKLFYTAAMLLLASSGPYAAAPGTIADNFSDMLFGIRCVL